MCKLGKPKSLDVAVGSTRTLLYCHAYALVHVHVVPCLVDDHYRIITGMRGMWFNHSSCCGSHVFISVCRYTQLEVDEHVAVCLSAMDLEEEDAGDFDFQQFMHD